MADYTDYTTDSTYWTIRKRGNWYLVLKLQSGTYDEVDRWGWYSRAGAAATAVGLLSYQQGLSDGERMMREALQEKLSELGLAVPKPDKPARDEPAEGEPEEDA